MMAMSAAIGRTAQANVISLNASFGCFVNNGVADDSASFQTDTSPFAHSYAVALGDWQCSSQHSGAFDEFQGSFSATDKLQSRDSGRDSYVITSGGIDLKTTSDLLVTVEGTTDYSVPGNNSDVRA